MAQENYFDRKERLRAQGKVELPMNIDAKKYLIGGLAFVDLLVIAPFVLLSVAIVIAHYLITGGFNQNIAIVSLFPTIAVLVLQLNKHPERKNISRLEYKIIWKAQFKRRLKKFYYAKGAGTDEVKEGEGDTRMKLPIKDIANGCIETKDNRLVKVIQVESINLSLMNKTRRDEVLESYETFINDLEEKQIQTAQIAQPVNLDSYTAWVKEEGREDREVLRKIKDTYLKQIDDIQKNKSMVTRKRYVVVSVKNKANAHENIELKANKIKSDIEYMLSGNDKLEAEILKNDDLIRLIYTCLDFENAQSQGSSIVGKASLQSQIVLGKQTKEELEERVRKKQMKTFN